MHWGLRVAKQTNKLRVWCCCDWRMRRARGRRSVGRGRGRASHTTTQRTTQGPVSRPKTAATVQNDVPVLSAAGLIVALSAPLGCAAYISASDDGPRRWVCETTCLDIVGLLVGWWRGDWAGQGDSQPKADVKPYKCGTGRLPCGMRMGNARARCWCVVQEVQ